jgi:putative glutamine amidotransferase
MLERKSLLMVLGVTDTMRPTLQFYTDWIRSVVPDVTVTRLSYLERNIGQISRCDGLVLTGGGDIHPEFYGRGDVLPLVHGVDKERDEFEFGVVKQALDIRLPILGICRGMQVANVALGGTMIPDVQSAGFQNHGKEKGATVDPRHAVRLQQGTMLHMIADSPVGEVNTNHHQAVAGLGRGLKPAAWSIDGLVEGLEWESPQGNPCLLLVQWHPERMVDVHNPLSRGLLEFFVNEVQASREVQKMQP